MATGNPLQTVARGSIIRLMGRALKVNWQCGLKPDSLAVYLDTLCLDEAVAFPNSKQEK